MPDHLQWLAVAGVLMLAVLIVLVIVALGRLRAIASSQAAFVTAELAVLKAQGQDLDRDLKLDLASTRRDHADTAQRLRGEVGERLSQFTGTTQQQLAGATSAQNEQLRAFSERLEAIRTTLDQRLDTLRNDNARKLDEMRATVDEKLQKTLETRLGESFRLVSDRLDQVHRGLGEMQSLAQGVGDLKRVLSNVKSRGTWGEMQLGALLADLFTPQQYGINVETVPGTGKRVEFAIRDPSRSDDSPCWIPVDSKFPVEEWERLQAAIELGDGDAAETARKALAQFARTQAKHVRGSYVCPPYTSDFAILFLPTESLYAELMSRPGLSDELQREYRVTLAGPSNFVAFLNVAADGLPARRDRAAYSGEVLAAAGRGAHRVRQVRRDPCRASMKLREASNTLDEARGKTRRSRASSAASRRSPSPRRCGCSPSPAPFVLEPDEPAPDEK